VLSRTSSTTLDGECRSLWVAARGGRARGGGSLAMEDGASMRTSIKEDQGARYQCSSLSCLVACAPRPRPLSLRWSVRDSADPQRCPPRHRRLPRPVPLQAPKGDLHRRRGNLHRIVHLLRKEGDPERRKRPPHLPVPGGYHRLQRRGEDRRPRSARQDLRKLRHRHRPR
jgi:hypothetical protein